MKYYSIEYSTVKENPKLYVTLYSENGEMLECVSDRSEGEFEKIRSNDNYTIKAFLWERDMKPIFKVKQKELLK